VKRLAELRAGTVCGCEWCLDFGSAIRADVAVDENDLRDLVRYERGVRFDMTRNSCCDPRAMSRSPVEFSDHECEQLRDHVDDVLLVEFTSSIGAGVPPRPLASLCSGAGLTVITGEWLGRGARPWSTARSRRAGSRRRCS
jgi:hypothetical protein